MSQRPWHIPQASEVRPRTSYAETVLLACALATFIVGFRVYKFVLGGFLK